MKYRHVLLIFTAFLFVLGSGCARQKVQIGQHPHHFSKTIEKTLTCQYLLYLPEQYASGKDRWPLLLFLHGAGERGDDMAGLLKYGPPLLASQRNDFPFIVLSPQCPKDQWWDTEVLIALLDEIVATYRVDLDRIYVTGLSMGGYGTWALAIAQPDRFAAIAPICGGGDARRVRNIKHLPVWNFHGAKDDIVSIDESERMVKALKAVGGNVRYTVYPEGGHGVWNETYANPELFEWMLSHRRGEQSNESSR